MRVSDYIIYAPLKNKEKEYVFFHGYSGAIDVVTEQIYNIFQAAKEDQDIIDTINEEDKKVLKDRGYLVNLNVEEERQLFNRISSKISEFSRKKGFSVSLVPTYGCNFRCPYCFASKVLDKVNEDYSKIMSFEIVDNIIKFIKKQREEGKRIGGIGLCGGEPLLKESLEVLKYLVKKCSENNLRISAITNGHDLDYYHELLGEGKIETIQITLDGLEDYHNNRRFLVGKLPTFNRIVDNIDWCLKNDVVVSVRTNIDQSNLNQIQLLMNFFEEKGWTNYPNFHHYFKGVNACFGEEEKPTYIDDIKLMEILKDKKLYYDKYEYNNMYSGIKNMVKDAFMSNRYPTVNVAHCSLPANGAVIDSYGNAYPCIELIGKEPYIIGKLDSEGNIIYNDSSNKWRSITVNSSEICSKCAYALYCGGGCPVKVTQRNGKSHSRDCENFKKIFNEVVPSVYEMYLKSEGNKR